LISPAKLVFVPELLIQKFQVWRLLTPFLVAGKFSFPFVMHLVVLYENSRRYETSPFNTGGGGTTADFIFALLIGGFLLLLAAYFFDFFILSESLLFMIMYINSRKDPTALMNMYGFRFKCIYTPWIYLGLRLVMGADIVMPFVGVVAGHLFYFIAVVLPETHGYTLLKTPSFCIDFVNYISGAPTGGGGLNIGAGITANAPPANRGGGGNRFPAPGNVPNPGATRATGHSWGRGHVLGAS
jgi:Derlin-2/3